MQETFKERQIHVDNWVHDGRIGWSCEAKRLCRAIATISVGRSDDAEESFPLFLS
jgi:hypothetical protein